MSMRRWMGLLPCKKRRHSWLGLIGRDGAYAIWRDFIDVMWDSCPPTGGFHSPCQLRWFSWATQEPEWRVDAFTQLEDKLVARERS